MTFVEEEDKAMSFISNILDKFGISATLMQTDDFEKWLVNEAWNKYSEDKMNNRIIIENRVKSECDLRVPNGTVRKDYLAKIELPVELVEDAWLDGSVEKLGLSWTLETDAMVEPVTSTESAETDESSVVENENSSGDSENIKDNNGAEVAETAAKPTKLILKITGNQQQLVTLQSLSVTNIKDG